MPLPPPPQAPPPGGARTQSLNRPIESPAVERGPAVSHRTRHPPGHGTRLDTVPPTPANWQEESTNAEATVHLQPNGGTSLHIDTGSILRKQPMTQDERASASASTPSHRRRDSSTGGLVRTAALRNRSVVGLRERRSESKHGKERATSNPPMGLDTDAAPWQVHEPVKPTNLNLGNVLNSGSSRRDRTRRTPGSGELMSSGKSVTFRSAPVTQELALPEDSNHSSTPTPPASASGADRQVSSAGAAPRRLWRLSQKLSLSMPGHSEQRPISHILHTPNQDDALPVPLTPSTIAKERPVSDLIGPESPKAFAERAVERHRNFAEREADAVDDSKRLELFVQFIVAESRIRREQYAALFQNEDINIGRLVRDLFRPIPTEQEDAEEDCGTPENTSRRVSNTSSAMADSSSQDEISSMSRKVDSPSSATTTSPLQPPAAGGVKDFIPCLSPIASMSVVTGPEDEMNSRGRPPSRWWEAPSQSGSAANDGFSVLGRTKRESKFMGLPREARDSGMFFDHQGSGGPRGPQLPIGWHEEVPNPAYPPPPPNPPTPASAPPFTPDARGLDISRLVTLPPPYPRHHPAVNNNHPDLADVRAVVRSLHDMDEPDSIRGKYQSEYQKTRKRADSWCEHQRSLHGQDLQYRMEYDDMTQEQFDALEAELEGKMQQSAKDTAQADFDMFQDMVVSPLHPLFAARIAHATSSLENLSSALFSDAQSRSPNMPQEEGDEQPELLEKLTQLKWLFEARETLHRRTYDLLSERNDKYKNVVLLPYKQSQNHAKVVDAEKFFSQDSLDRRKKIEKAVADRAHAFMTVIEHNVARGVEMQLDAFWQIAPIMKESVLHKIPHEIPLRFEIRIPADEYEENPDYYDHPLQYLYILLGHAEKATFQFIESQINLLCLLHEIRSCALSAKCKVEVNDGRLSNVDSYPQQEERRLTADLKDKVGVIEGQWADALGEEMTSVRERVRGRLLEDGGWDDEMEDV
ncbi:uncharacterized protein KY384_004355 [Bacidia gigantensis]|uniref:uncharacterized protein n=1 Tax=Bacidia gigantensis TaxID=2732470 RepID=UPI001D03C017|nr:uncharacterized protein KY384_004355 [Bacidia gigantensis]KAG8530998.1 hypothetical protein KY384_004355 [Bacidia gigantensis]